MYKLGITGGIGSGKSTASNFFKKMGATVFNADKEAKKHLKKSITLQNRIIDAFGQKVVENNKLSIKNLAEVAFSNKFEQNILNGLMWPEIFILVDNAMSQAKQKKTKLFILDAAMLFEANFNPMLDSILLISAKKYIRIDRALNRKNLHLEQIQNRMSLQMPEKEKLLRASFVIENNRSSDKFIMKLEKYYSSLPI